MPRPADPPPKNRPEPRASSGPRKGFLLRLLVWIVAMSVACTALGVAGAYLGYLYVESDLPEVFSFSAYRRNAVEVSRAYAASGEIIAEWGKEIRTVVPVEQIPAVMRYAAVSAEDGSFFNHPGLDLVGIARALVRDLREKRFAQGASTITQQVAKTFYLSPKKTLGRKARELVLARKLEQRLSKDEILALYLNQIYFGHGRYGIEEAARFFFGKPVSQVNLAEAALIAGLVQAPERLSPLKNPKACEERRAYVLEQMAKNGYITAEQAVAARKTELPSKATIRDRTVGAYFTEAVRRKLFELVGADRAMAEGLRVETTLDMRAQVAAERAAREGLERIDGDLGSARPLRHTNEIDKEAARLLTARKGAALELGEIADGVVRVADRDKKAYVVDVGGEQGILPFDDVQRYANGKLGKGKAPPADALWVPGDVVRVSIRERTDKRVLLTPEQGPQLAIVAIEPETRFVRALVGGDRFDLHPFNRALQARRQPGSTFKPFAYGAGIEAGVLQPDTRFVNDKAVFKVDGRAWTPRNFDGQYDGKSYTAREALAQSINVVAVRVGEQVTPERVREFATKAGILSELKANLTLALGSSSVTPIELVNAYASVAAGGRMAEPILVTRIVDRTGKDLYVAPHARLETAMKADTARALTDMMTAVVEGGTGRAAKKAGRPVAGKTGTSNRSIDTWFVGFVPQLCAGVWVGYDDRRPIPKGTGGQTAAPIFADFMAEALKGVPVQPLPRVAHAPAPIPPAEGSKPPDEVAVEVEDEALDEKNPPPMREARDNVGNAKPKPPPEPEEE